MVEYPAWAPICDLTEADRAAASTELPALSRVWHEQRSELEASGALAEFIRRLNREWAIETGIIERLYSLDRGVTRLLIEQGLDSALIAHGDTDQPAEYVMALIQDQYETVEGLFDFVGGQRPLSTAYIKEMHASLSRRQAEVEAVDQFGRRFPARMLHGEYKRRPNNPTGPDGQVFEYCPPEHVAAEMDRLVELHHHHQATGLPPELSAAWLHHRFTQIHPFQDGNGRVARALASLVFLRAGLFPLVVTRDERGEYLDALSDADRGDLGTLVDLFSRLQRSALVKALGLSAAVRQDRDRVGILVTQLAEEYARRSTARRDSLLELAESLRIVGLARMEALRVSLADAFADVPDAPKVFVDGATNTDQTRRSWHRLQIVESARKLDYWADLRTFAVWVRLVLETPVGRSEILLSIHGLGPSDRGLMAASLTFCRRGAEMDGSHPVLDVHPASDTLFQFNAYDTLPQAEDRFRRWLEGSLVNALEMLRRGE